MFDVMNGFNYQKYLIFAAIQKRYYGRRLADRQTCKSSYFKKGTVSAGWRIGKPVKVLILKKVLWPSG
jgi:hypothetical protein